MNTLHETERSTNDTDILLLVDGSGFLHRAFHAMPALSTSSGQPTGAIRGVLNMVFKMVSLLRPTRIALVFDAPGRTFRHEQYPLYKANRPHMPEVLSLQISPLFSVLQAEGFPVISQPGVEADDVLATLATQAARDKCHVLIATSDKDLTQLLQPFIQIFNPVQEKIVGVEEFQAKWGFEPQRFIDYLALLGDASDNIPGVAGIGDKTAQKLVQTYASWKEFLEHIPEISGKVGERLRQHREDLLLSRQLATLSLQLPLELGWKQLERRPRDQEQLKHWYGLLEFRHELSALQTQTPAVESVQLTLPIVVFSEVQPALLDLLRSWVNPVVVLPWLDPTSGHCVGLTFGGDGSALYLCVPASGFNGCGEELKHWFANPDSAKIIFDSKALRHLLMRSGWVLGGLYLDVQLALFALDVRQSQDVRVQAERRWGQQWSTVKPKQMSREAMIADQYALAQATGRLAAELLEELAQKPTVQHLLHTVDMPMLDLLFAMETHGVLVSVEELSQQNAQLSVRLDQLRQQILELAGVPFNPDSPKQLAEVLYDRLGLLSGRKTATGLRSTSEEALELLMDQHPLPGLCLEYRRLGKLRSTYTQKLPELVRSDTGRIHTTYHPTGTSTGRLSSSDPNLQNIPIRSTEGRRIREAFIAQPGYYLMSADYSQIELRIMAHYSQDPGLLKAFAEGGDVHRSTAAEMFAVQERDVSSEQRRAAKAINFGLIYGMSAFGLAKQLGMGRMEAETIVERYFQKYPGVRAYMEDIKQQAQRQGYVETILGRKLMLPDLASLPVMQKAAVLRAAVNAPMQGSAAEIMKRAMQAVAARLAEPAHSTIFMVLQVHDELVFEVPQNDCVEVAGWVRQAMQEACALRVPLEVVCAWGLHWGAAH